MYFTRLSAPSLSLQVSGVHPPLPLLLHMRVGGLELRLELLAAPTAPMTKLRLVALEGGCHLLLP